MKMNIIDKISLEMMNTKETQMDNDYITDEQIIEKISQLDDINLCGAVDGRSLLIHAAFYNRKGVAEYLLKSGIDIHLKDKVGFTALHAAVNSSHEEIAKLLLLNGADVNAKDGYGNTALFRASHLNIDIIKLLLEFGADANIENNFGVSSKYMFSAYPEILDLMS